MCNIWLNMIVIYYTWVITHVQAPTPPHPTARDSSNIEASETTAHSIGLMSDVAGGNGIIACGSNTFTISIAHFPPYCMIHEGDIKGAVASTFFHVLETCCGNNVAIQHHNTYSQLRKVEEEVTSEDVIMPVVKTGLTVINDVEGYLFLPVLETSGSTVVIKPVETESNLGTPLIDSWPLALTVFFSATLAGIVVWILDRYWNPDEFPKSFLHGCWEGTWWAFVTMTTVGYGDRAPKSIPARCFGLVWMFIGILLMAIFTATLTTALSSDLTTKSEIELGGATICVLAGSLEEILAYKNGAVVNTHDNSTALLEAVNNAVCDAGLVDSNFALYEYFKIDKYSLDLDTTISNNAVYGITLYNQNTSIERCFAREISKSSFRVYDEMIRLQSNPLKAKKSNKGKAVQTIYKGMIPVVIAIISLWALVFTLCMIWECFYHRPRMKRLGKDADGKDLGNQKSKQNLTNEPKSCCIGYTNKNMTNPEDEMSKNKSSKRKQ